MIRRALAQPGKHQRLGATGCMIQAIRVNMLHHIDQQNLHGVEYKFGDGSDSYLLPNQSRITIEVLTLSQMERIIDGQRDIPD